jgi:hypothetical protein
MELLISQLIEYAVRKGWLEESDPYGHPTG